VLIGSAICCNGANDSTLVRLSGIVESADTTDDKLVYVHIVNLRNRTGVISDSLGLFRMNIRHTDTLLFRSLGYQDFLYHLPDTFSTVACFIRVQLSPVSYQLTVVDIIALSRQSQFRYDFIHLKQEPYNRELIIPGITKKEREVIDYDQRALVPIGSPVSLLYSAFNQKQKSLRKLIELKEHDKMSAKIEPKYNKKQIMRFTGYNDSVAYLFMQFLDYPEAYLLNTSEYELYVDISKRMLEFEEIYKNIIPKELKRE
jgi:hypothetical protein